MAGRAHRGGLVGGCVAGSGGNAAGQFGSPQSFTRRAHDHYTDALVDLAEHGVNDLAVTFSEFPGSQQAGYYPGDGDGGFGAHRTLVDGFRGAELFAVDIDGDGLIDLGTFEGGGPARWRSRVGWTIEGRHGHRRQDCRNLRRKRA